MGKTKYLISYSHRNTKTGAQLFWNDIVEEHPLEWLQRKIGVTGSYIVFLNWQAIDENKVDVDLGKLSTYMGSQ